MKTLVKLKWWDDFKEADVEVVCRVKDTDLLYIEAIIRNNYYHQERNYINYFEFKNPNDKEKLVREFKIKEIIE
jgi:hypothetical protein